MTDHRGTPSGTTTNAPGSRTPGGMPAPGPQTAATNRPHADGSSGDGGRRTWDDLYERERVGIHDEAQTIRRDRIRWGPVWAGIATAVGTYLFLQLALIATGWVELGDAAGDDAIASGIAALVAFFLGGLTTGATAMWQGADDGLLHGIVMWFAALVAIIVFSAVGSGLALGSFDTADVFDDVTLDDIDTAQANDDARDAAGKALVALTLGLVAAAAGGAIGSKLWPRDDRFVEVVRRKQD